jgi:hypothetical protein
VPDAVNPYRIYEVEIALGNRQDGNICFAAFA